jgi:hypothetical protein
MLFYRVGQGARATRAWLATGAPRAVTLLVPVSCVWRDFCGGIEISRLLARADAEVLVL